MPTPPRFIVDLRLTTIVHAKDPWFMADIVKRGFMYDLTNFKYYTPDQSLPEDVDALINAKTDALDYIQMKAFERKSNPWYPYPTL